MHSEENAKEAFFCDSILQPVDSFSRSLLTLEQTKQSCKLQNIYNRE